MADSIIVANNSDAAFVEVDAIPVGYSNDGIFYKTVSGKHYKIANDGNIRAIKAGILFDGTDQTSRINTVISHADVKELVFDSYGESVTISGAVTIPAGKKVVFKNGCKLIGAGTYSGGIIECDLLKQCFASTIAVSNIENNLISVAWFGGIADYKNDGTTVSPTDNLTAFNRALHARKKLSALAGGKYDFRSKVYIPAGNTDYWYYLSDTWIIDVAIELYGDGYYQTILKFPPALGDAAIWFRFPDQETNTFDGGRDNYTHDFQVTAAFEINQSYGTAVNDGASQGLLLQTNNCIFERVWINRFNADGWRIDASVGGVPYTNANNCTFINCKGNNNSGNGIHFKNTDSNNCTIVGGDFEQNAVWGVKCDSLGNTFLGVHAAGNGQENTYARTSVYNLGTLYFCLTDNTTKEPGVTSGWQTDWEVFATGYGSPPTGFPQWVSGNTYKEGGNYGVLSASDKSHFVGCYAEGDAHVYTNKGTAMVVGGFLSQEGVVASGTIGNRQGVITSKNWQIFDETNDYGLRMFIGAGFMWMGGIDELRNKNFGFKYNTDGTGQYIRLVEGFGDTAPFFAMDSAFAEAVKSGYFGRSGSGAMSGYGEIMFSYGFFILGDKGAGKRRKIETGIAQPTTGSYGEGDIIFNNEGDKCGPIGWYCISAGNFSDTPPVFQEIYGYTKGTTANRPSGLGSGNAGAMYYDTDIDAPIWWDGAAWQTAGSSGQVETLNVQYTDAANSGTSETDLMSYTLPAGQLANDGDRIEILGSFQYAANANTKTLKFKFGSYSATWGSSEVTSSGGPVKFTATIIRTSATTQKIVWEFSPQFGTHSTVNSTGSETLSGAVTLKFTGESNTASNDITQKTMTVTYYPAP